METEQLTTAVAVFSAEAEIEKFPIKGEDLTAMALKCAELTIKGLEDKEGYKAVSAARKELKSTRTKITNAAKEIRDPALKLQRMVIAREKELIALIEPTEDRLQALEEGWEKLVEDARLEEERKKADRIQGMLTKLNAVEFAVDFMDLQAMDDEQFADILAKATAEFEQIKTKREEERIAKEAADLIAEGERLAEQERLNIQKRQQEEAQRKLEQERDAFRLEQERAKKEIAAKAEAVTREVDALAFQQARLKQQRTKSREDRLKAIGMYDHALGMVYTHEHNPGQILCGRAHILDLTDEGFEEHLEMMSRHVEEFRRVGDDNKQRKEAEAAAAKLIREEEAKKEKELQMSDMERFALIRAAIEEAYMDPWAMQSAWGKTAVGRIKNLLDEAIEICKANETSDGK